MSYYTAVDENKFRVLASEIQYSMENGVLLLGKFNYALKLPWHSLTKYVTVRKEANLADFINDLL